MKNYFLLISFAVFVFLHTASNSYTNDSKSYPSPDGAIEAKISSIAQSGESQVKILVKGNVVMCEQDYTSQTGTNGLVVEQAGWTPDGQFFIFSASSSGGHQPWRSPMFFFSRQHNKIFDFQTYLPPIANPNFTVKQPDFITVTIWTPFSEKGTTDSITLPISFRLGNLLQQSE